MMVILYMYIHSAKMLCVLTPTCDYNFSLKIIIIHPWFYYTSFRVCVIQSKIKSKDGYTYLNIIYVT